jgi:hypothetical protein
MSFHETIELIKDRPVIALCVGLSHIGFAGWLHTVEIPNIIMQILQALAWCTTITVGLITIYGFIKKKRKK